MNSKNLTQRELQILDLLISGKCNKEVAAALAISIKTVEKYRQSLYEKLNVHSLPAMIKTAILCGYINVEDWLSTP